MATSSPFASSLVFSLFSLSLSLSVSVVEMTPTLNMSTLSAKDDLLSVIQALQLTQTK